MNFQNSPVTKSCRDCGIDFEGRGTLSTKRCRTCTDANARSKRERKKRANKRTVKRPKIQGWETKRRPGLEPNCVACGVEFAKPGAAAVDHIVSAAIVDELNKGMGFGEVRRSETDSAIEPISRAFRPYNPEATENLASACRSCHGMKRRAEIKLERGDVVGFLAEIVRIGYPKERTEISLRLYGLLR